MLDLLHAVNFLVYILQNPSAKNYFHHNNYYFLGFTVLEEQLKEAAEQSGVLQVKEDFLDHAFRVECERLIPNIQDVEAKDCIETYL